MTKTGFTMKQYMEENGIPGSPHDSNMNKMLREHFGKLGLVRVRRGNHWVWVRKDEARPRTNYSEAECKLRSLTNGKA